MTTLVLLLGLLPSLACQPRQEGGRPPTAEPAAAATAAAPAEAAPAPEAPEPPQAEPAPPLKVAVLSDLNGRYGSAEYAPLVHRAVERLVELRPALVLVAGDMVAGQRPDLDYEAMWAGFHQAVTDPLTAAGIPLAVTPGNHDGSGYERYQAERAEFVRQWRTRRPALAFQAGDAYPERYAFTMGPALFVALDATETGPLAAEQRQWLSAQLRAGADRPVKVVFGHLPISPVTVGREEEALFDEELEALLVAEGVDLYISGHHHAYYPGRRGAFRQLAIGCLGGGARPLLGTTTPAPRSLVLLELGADGALSFEAFTGENLDESIDRATLPDHLGEGVHRLTRDDG